MKRTFIVAGYEGSKIVDSFMQALDLGVDGVRGKPFLEKLTMTINDNCSQEKLDKQLDAVKRAYEELGCKEVFVWEPKGGE